LCRNCGAQVVATAEFCPACGARPLVGYAFCNSCGAPTTPLSEICVKCGTKLTRAPAAAPPAPAAAVRAVPAEGVSPKSRLAVTLLSALPAGVFMIFGVHRFYLGKIGTGVAMLLTLGGLGVWGLVDFIMAVSGKMKDKEGRVILDWHA